jgi:hypothetical protein
MARIAIDASDVRTAILQHSDAWATNPSAYVLTSAELRGELDLDSLDIDCPVRFVDCSFQRPWRLRSGSLRSLALKDCSLEALDLSGSKIEGNFAVDDCRIARSLELSYLSVGGSFNLSGCEIGSGGTAITAFKLGVAGNCAINNKTKIEGFANLSNGRFDAGIEIDQVEIRAPDAAALALNEAVITADLQLTDSSCEGQVQLLGTSVVGVVNLENLRLVAPPEETITGSPHIEKGVSLYADRLKTTGDVFFATGFQAQGEVRLLGAAINGDLTFYGAELNAFPGEADALSANNSNIGANVFFMLRTTVNGRAMLRNCTIGGVVRLYESSTFRRAGNEPECVTFDQTSVRGDVRLKDCNMFGIASFSRCQFGMLDLQEGTNVASCVLDLSQTHCTLLSDALKSWRDFAQYDLIGFTYDALAQNKDWTIEECRNWLKNAQRGVFSPQTYEHLAKIQRQMGFGADAREMMIARETRRPEMWGSTDRLTAAWRRMFHWIYGQSVCYGYRPSRAFTWALALWIVGAVLIYWAAVNHGFFPAKTLDATRKASYPMLVSPIYSLEAMVPFLKLHQDEFWLPDHATLAGWLIQLYLWLHTLAGWILGTFLVASVTGLVRKE